MGLFWLWPRHWGLRGRDRKEARIRYNAKSDYDAELEIIKLDFPQLFDENLEQDEDEDFIAAEQRAYDEAVLDVQLKHGKIRKKEYDEKMKDMSGEGWVKVIGVEYNPDKPEQAGMVLDYNEQFVIDLRAAGYEGQTDDEVVSQWLDHLFLSSLVEDVDLEIASDIKTQLDAARRGKR